MEKEIYDLIGLKRLFESYRILLNKVTLLSILNATNTLILK